jgi:hypothetical protein
MYRMISPRVDARTLPTSLTTPSIISIMRVHGAPNPDPMSAAKPPTQMQTQIPRKLQRAFHPSQRFNLALPLPFGPGLTLEPSRADPERLELLPNSYCRLLPGRPPLLLLFAWCSLHSSLQNHFVRPTGALSRFTQARWNHSRGQSSLSHATILPYDTSLQ